MKFLIFFFCLLCLYFEVKAQNTNDKIVLIDSTSKMPQFVGGAREFANYLHSTLKYPIQAKIKSIRGSVELSFIVEKDGSLSNIEVIKSVSPNCDKEAVRVLKNSPKWEAGKQGNEVVRVRTNLSIEFSRNPHCYHCVYYNFFREAEFPGGKKKFMKYIYLRLQYPETRKKNQVKGIIWTEFVINKMGKVGNIQIVKGLSPEADKEVIKVLENSPYWTPRKYRRESTNCKMYIPVVYLPDFNIRDKEQNTLFFLNGKEISKYDFLKIEPETIKDIELIDKKKLKKQYDKKSRNGAILVYTKKIDGF